MSKITIKSVDAKVVDTKPALSLKKGSVQQLKVRTYLKGGAAKLVTMGCGSGCHCTGN